VKRDGAKDMQKFPVLNVQTISVTEHQPKRKVLTEEKYLDAVSTIMKRDFFPDLERLEAQDAFLSAMERADLAGIRLAAEDLTNRKSKRRSRLDNLSLDEFQSRYVTEDNASFEELLYRWNKLKRDSFKRHFGQAPLLGADPNQRLLLMPSVGEVKLNEERRVLRKNTRFPKISHTQRSAAGEEEEQLAQHYTEIVAEHTEEQDSSLATSIAELSSSKKRAFAIKEMSSRELLGHSISDAMQRERQRSLMRSPAVQRILQQQRRQQETERSESIFGSSYKSKR